MGFVKRHIVGTGMHIQSPDTTIELIVREIGGTRLEQTARVEVQGIPNLQEIFLSQQAEDILLEGVIKIGIAKGNRSYHNDSVGIFYHAPKKYDMQYRIYD